MVKIDENLQSELDEQMQEGYKLSMSGKTTAAADMWIGLWRKFIDTMDLYNLEYIEDMDKAFSGLQSIYNWSMDFEVELSNAAREDKRFVQSKIDFCTKYIALKKDKNEYNVLVLKRVIAASYFEMGETDEGEKLFKAYIKEHPTSGWGWIHWSDQYGMFSEPQNRDIEKAIQILEQGLEVEGLNDKLDVLERLEALYTELGMTQESVELLHKIADEKGKRNIGEWEEVLPLFQKNPLVKTIKVGRNDPCPCGSGKKYKKCCGK
ncbi:SEC-C metal-binding domain-containing protein [Oceanobacillus indicireducens]|uniref:SEC-C domain-containing protein n=1 Tax=Oceanobacillus indicireducens TaxID=1004261 RepID=A0A917XWE7_9BACI|nr:SEC-C metal-binding domain-containing protein [Oceanobacillus indicireducens]GGN54474.1 hypothetical protein GCM10007971_12240 [Oceanobacillus indicireducens]